MNYELRTTQSAILPQQHLYQADAVLQLQPLTGHIVLAQLHLQQVITEGDASPYGHFHVLPDACQQAVNGIKRLHFLIQRHQLPVVLFRLQRHLVLCQLQLQQTDILTNLGKTVSIDNLSTGKDGLYGIDTRQHTVLEHGDADGTGQCRQCLSGQHLCHRGSQ